MMFFTILIITSLLSQQQSFAFEETKKIKFHLKYPHGDRAETAGAKLIFYTEHSKVPYTIIERIPPNPYFETILPIHEKYKIEIYIKDMFSGESYFDPRENNDEIIDLLIYRAAGLTLQVYYDDGYTPIENARVLLYTYNNTKIQSSKTDNEGNTIRYWIRPTFNDAEYYKAEIKIGKDITYEYSPIKIEPGNKELKIITPWPSIIQSLITVKAYNDANLLVKSSSNQHFDVELYDMEKNLIRKSPINNRGEAYFSNLRVGDYHLIINNEQGKNLIFSANQTITILSDTKELSITGHQSVKSNHSSDIENLGFLQQGVIINSTTESSHYSTILSKKPELSKQSCNCVSFRLDDIQDFWLNDIQIEVMEIFSSRELPLTVGVIGNRIGDDTKIISYLNQNIPKGKLEIANHGWDHEDFTQYNKTDQSYLMQKTNEKLKNLFGIYPNVFIPPLNSFNEDTTTVMLENGITHFSSEFDFSTPPYPLVDSRLYNFPEGAVTGKLTANKDIIMGVSHKLTLSQVKQSIDEYGFAVVTMHPQEFSETMSTKYSNQVNEKQIRELELLLDRLPFEEIKIVPLNEINLDSVKDGSIPKWIKNTAKWWSNGTISESEFIVALQFLVKEKIIFLHNIPAANENESEEIPMWIKNNAEWWAEGKISDREFALGIKYFVENGIISV